MHLQFTNMGLSPNYNVPMLCTHKAVEAVGTTRSARGTDTSL